MALCSSWYDPRKPADLIADPAAFVAAFSFWKNYYRKGFDGNRQKYAYDSPPMHDEWIDIFAYHRHSIVTCFRDAGKTMVLGEELPEFLITTRPHTTVQYTTAAQDLSEKQVRVVRTDIQNNSRIIDDFGMLRDTSSDTDLLWRQEEIELINGSGFKAISVEKKQRGSTQRSLRPICLIMDDWEVDKRLKNAQLRSDAEDYLHNVLFPMIEPGAWILWPNTLISQQSWAMKYSSGEDARSKGWFSKRFDPEYIDDKGVRRSAWPARFPLEALDAMKGEGSDKYIGLGKAAYASEMENKPGAKDDKAFEYLRERHGYYWQMEGTELVMVEYGSRKRTLYKDLVKRSVGIVGVDLALGIKKRGCYAACDSCRVDSDGCLWALEVWEKREPPMTTLYQAIAMGEYWQSLVIAIERVAFEQIAIDLLQADIDQRKLQGRYAPEIYPVIMAGAEPKEYRALKMQYRFREDKIRIPVPPPAGEPTPFLPFPAFSESLEEQITYFTPLGGNLKYRDVLDALVNVQITTLALGAVLLAPETIQTQLDMMREARKEGDIYWPGSQNVDALSLAKARAMRPKLPDEEDHDLISLSEHFPGDMGMGGVFDLVEEF